MAVNGILLGKSNNSIQKNWILEKKIILDSSIIKDNYTILFYDSEIPIDKDFLILDFKIISGNPVLKGKRLNQYGWVNDSTFDLDTNITYIYCKYNSFSYYLINLSNSSSLSLGATDTGVGVGFEKNTKGIIQFSLFSLDNFFV